MSDSESQVIFPKDVAVAVTFKGANGKNLIPQLIKGHQYLTFASDDINDVTLKNEISTRLDGNIRIKNTSLGKFWRRSSDNWIWADSDDTLGSDPDTLFELINVGDSVIALKNKGKKLFCVSLSTDGQVECLSACSSEITIKAHLEVNVVV